MFVSPPPLSLSQFLSLHLSLSLLFPPQPKFQFSIRHYAGLVTYSSAGFVEKNKDQIHDEASDLVKYSSNPALHQSYSFVEAAQKARAAAGVRASLSRACVCVSASACPSV